MALTKQQRRERMWIGLCIFLAALVALGIWRPTFSTSTRRYRAYQVNSEDDWGLWGEIVYVDTAAQMMPWTLWSNVMNVQRRPWLDRDSTRHTLPKIFGWQNGRLFSTGFKYQQ